MITKKDIGKKVWVLEGDIYKGLALKSKKAYTIKSVDNTNYPAKVAVEKDGNEIETTEYNIIFMPLGNNLLKYLYDNGVSSVVDAGETAEGAVVEIEWGDWKHDHLWCDDLMGYLGYTLTNEIETEEDGSDCYSAERYYEKTC